MVRFWISLVLVIVSAPLVTAAEPDASPWRSSLELELGNDFFVRDLLYLSGGELLIAGDQLVLPPVTDGGPEPISHNYVQLHEPDGSLRWQVIMPGSGRSAEFGEVAVDDTESEVFLTGHLRFEQAPLRRLFVAKLSISGELLWQFESEDDADLLGHAVVAATDGGAYVAGSYWPEEGGQGPGAFVLRLTPDGEVAWHRVVSHVTESSFSALAVHPDGSVTAAGASRSAVAGRRRGISDAVLFTFDQAGQLLWQAQFGSEGGTAPVRLQADAEGLLVLGETFGPLTDTAVAADDVFLTRFSFSGDQLWTSQFGGNDNDRAVALASNGDGSIHVAALFASYADAFAPVVHHLGVVEVSPGEPVRPVGIEFNGALGGTALRQLPDGPVLMLAMNEGDGWQLHEFDPQQLPALD